MIFSITIMKKKATAPCIGLGLSDIINLLSVESSRQYICTTYSMYSLPYFFWTIIDNGLAWKWIRPPLELHSFHSCQIIALNPIIFTNSIFLISIDPNPTKMRPPLYSVTPGPNSLFFSFRSFLPVAPPMIDGKNRRIS